MCVNYEVKIVIVLVSFFTNKLTSVLPSRHCHKLFFWCMFSLMLVFRALTLRGDAAFAGLSDDEVQGTDSEICTVASSSMDSGDRPNSAKSNNTTTEGPCKNIFNFVQLLECRQLHQTVITTSDLCISAPIITKSKVLFGAGCLLMDLL